MRSTSALGPNVANQRFQEIAFAQKRMALEGRAQRGPYTKAKLKKIFTSWHIYTLVLLYV